MRWYKTASDWGHGNTFEGQKMARDMKRVTGLVRKLRESAADGGPWGVLGRWRGEVRRRILLLPPVERVERMSMMELDDVEKEARDIVATMTRYSEQRQKEIRGECQ